MTLKGSIIAMTFVARLVVRLWQHIVGNIVFALLQARSLGRPVMHKDVTRPTRTLYLVNRDRIKIC